MPNQRGKGINRLIIDTLRAWGLSKGIHEFVLKVYAEYSPAIRAYEKVGFQRKVIEMRMELTEN